MLSELRKEEFCGKSSFEPTYSEDESFMEGTYEEEEEKIDTNDDEMTTDQFLLYFSKALELEEEK